MRRICFWALSHKWLKAPTGLKSVRLSEYVSADANGQIFFRET
jgi:hypothetical protein